MTNLIEKSLLIGFGILTLTIFISIIIPLFGAIVDFNQNERTNLERCLLFINEIDQGVQYVIENPEGIYLKNIEYPNEMNTTFYDNRVKFEFYIDNQLCVRINEYSHNFVEICFCQMPAKSYFLNISNSSTLIKVNLT
jgi:hypothetical protein